MASGGQAEADAYIPFTAIASQLYRAVILRHKRPLGRPLLNPAPCIHLAASPSLYPGGSGATPPRVVDTSATGGRKIRSCLGVRPRARSAPAKIFDSP